MLDAGPAQHDVLADKVGSTTVRSFEEIDEEAEARGADLIVIGTRGLSGFKHLLLGSIAERVVQKAPCAVLTVKPRAGA